MPKLLHFLRRNYRVFWEACPQRGSVSSRASPGTTGTRVNELHAGSQRERTDCTCWEAARPGGPCTNPRTHQGSLQPQRCARQFRTRRPRGGRGARARRARVRAGMRPAPAEPASPSPRETDAARGAGAPGGLVAPAPGADRRADLWAPRHSPTSAPPSAPRRDPAQKGRPRPADRIGPR